MVSRSTVHRRHPAYDARPAHPDVRPSGLATQLIIAALSFAVMVGAAFHALQGALGN
jgi:hypothetical protein